MLFDALGTAAKWQGWSVHGVESAVLSELQQDGLAHHMVGLVDRNGQDVGLDTQTTMLKVSRVNVIKPGLTDGVYDYAAYAERPVDALVPLEIFSDLVFQRFFFDEACCILGKIGFVDQTKFGDLFESKSLVLNQLEQPTDTFQKKLVWLQDSPTERCIG